MGGKTPVEKRRPMGLEAPDEIALMRTIILRRIISHDPCQVRMRWWPSKNLPIRPPS